MPCFGSDSLRSDLPTLIAASHTLKTCARPGTPGRPKYPGKAPHPALVYTHVLTQKATGGCPASPNVCGAERFKTLGLTLSTLV
jgi:hypothetical protein